MPENPLTPYALYLAGAVGAAGLYLLLRPGPKQIRIAGTLVALAGAALLVLEVLRGLPNLPGDVPVFPVVLGFIALAGAVRMVTHPKPVFAALYFILVVIASAGLFLMLQAEFMAFALIIVYAGAILITYMFVLMLAHQVPNDGDVEGGSLYDRVPREPLSAILVAFLMLATLTNTFFGRGSELRTGQLAADATQASARAWTDLEKLPRRLAEVVRSVDPEAAVAPDANGHSIEIRDDGVAMVRVTTKDLSGASAVRRVELPASALPTNTQAVGLALVSRFPASLELASVILLMAMFGAVVLARKQIELGEDERREAAGMRRLSVDEPEAARGGRA